MTTNTALAVSHRPLPALPHDRAYRIGYAILRVLDRKGFECNNRGLAFSRVRVNGQRFALYQIGLGGDLPGETVAGLCDVNLLLQVQATIGLPLQMMEQGGAVIWIVDLYPPRRVVPARPRLFNWLFKNARRRSAAC